MKINSSKLRQIVLLSHLLFFIVTACENSSPKQKVQKTPNILFVLADDQSWLHTSISGNKVIKTPAFDRVANEGVLFTNAFAACPSCTPSRTAILSGQEIWRTEEAGLLMGAIPKDL
ncbi:MAG: sulfatase-like hydrolase/transferase, partial [Prolixibacteraceae bacterium]|nr:sulfatase-like hydrolase/transferase [Prolixibacteraceae bacterium]